MSRKRKCNRCGEDYIGIHGGSLKLSDRDPSITAHLCPVCYDEMVNAYEQEVDE